MGKAIRESSFGTRLGKMFLTGNVLLPTEQEDYSYPCMWTMSNSQAKQKYHFLTMLFWAVLKESAKPARLLWRNFRDVFESMISAGAKEDLPTRASGKLDAETISYWSYDMHGKVHAKKCVERYCEFANKATQTGYTKSQHHAWITIILKKKKKSVGELSTVLLTNCSQNVCMARVGRPDILWSVNKLAHAVTNWTKSCDKRLAFDLLHSSYK